MKLTPSVSSQTTYCDVECQLFLLDFAVTRDENLSSHVECESQASEWSPCSKSCGLGISTRVTNMNRGCELKRESRLCLLRPCTQRVTSKVIPLKHDSDLDESRSYAVYDSTSINFTGTFSPFCSSSDANAWSRDELDARASWLTPDASVWKVSNRNIVDHVMRPTGTSSYPF